MDVATFVEAQLPPTPARVLEVGCGAGDLARADASLHRYAELRTALDQRFKERYFAWTPYLHSELGRAQLEREERDLIEAGEIRAIGFNYVGET